MVTNTLGAISVIAALIIALYVIDARICPSARRPVTIILHRFPAVRRRLTVTKYIPANARKLAANSIAPAVLAILVRQTEE